LRTAIDRGHQPIDQTIAGDVIGARCSDAARDRARLVTRIAARIACREVLGVARDHIAITVDDCTELFGHLFAGRHL
jgi:hypothetical protein